MGIVIVCLGAALNLALLLVIYLRVAAIDRATRARARPESQALGVTAKRLSEIVTSLETEVLRAQAATAEQTRACVIDLRKAVDNAAELLIEQRAYTAELSVTARSVAEQRRSAAPAAPEPEDDQRRTVEMPRGRAINAPLPLVADEDEPEEERTQVASRPLAGTPAAPNGLRLTPRATIPPPPASRRGGER